MGIIYGHCPWISSMDIHRGPIHGMSLIYSFERNNLDEKTKDICIKMLNNETLESIENVKRNLPLHLRLLLIGHTNTKKSNVTTEEIDYLSSILWKNKKLREYVEDKIVIKENGILDKIKRCNDSYDFKLLDEIVQVGESVKVSEY